MVQEIPDGMVMQLAFDPRQTKDLREIFEDDLARMFYLTWRSCHIVTQHFTKTVRQVVRIIREENPQTAEELAGIYMSFGCGSDVTNHDWKNFATEFFRFMTGEKTISYVVNIDQ